MEYTIFVFWINVHLQCTWILALVKNQSLTPSQAVVWKVELWFTNEVPVEFGIL